MARPGRPSRAQLQNTVAKAIAAQDQRLAKKLLSDKEALDQIRARMPQLIDKLFEMALSPDQPDRIALINLLDRVLGKPTERVELEQQGEFELKIKIEE